MALNRIAIILQDAISQKFNFRADQLSSAVKDSEKPRWPSVLTPRALLEGRLNTEPHCRSKSQTLTCGIALNPKQQNVAREPYKL